MALAYFHYVLGLLRLGHEVLYLEESGWPESCYNPQAGTNSDDPTYGLQTLQDLMASFGVKVPICYVNRDSGQVQGLDWRDVKDMLRQADLLLNLGGVCWLPEFRLSRRLALVDMDPFFTQAGCFGVEGLNEHHVHFSYGVNIGQPDCTVPSGGIDWLPTVPPVVPEIWQISALPRKNLEITDVVGAPFTTIANWSAYGGITYQGEHYGQKDEEFLRMLELPSKTPQRLELAVSGSSAETTERFRSAGWFIRDSGDISTDVSTYHNYILGSRGEFSVAKNAYVKTRSGWFSDRSVCYLASGRPVLLQDTGFSDWLETGSGIIPFKSSEEALAGIEEINRRYEFHCHAARKIAEDYFDARKVLSYLIDRACNPAQALATDRFHPFARPDDRGVNQQ